ncbi:hypothetical protein [Synechococcus sp. PCC 7336]|uniref:hypothetical protein n=1 Tax=Synechococcus sp. PCC 7336 TaxID=195250 RepID=UPI00036A6FBC|nr:hypothetical protein [Synechococcus sp. PCC 7336]
MEFLIDSVKEIEDLLYVEGACNKGTIKIGDTFQKVYRNILARTPEGNYEVTDIENLRYVNLKIVMIKAYGHAIDELYSGMSGGLFLEGSKDVSISKQDILGG